MPLGVVFSANHWRMTVSFSDVEPHQTLSSSREYRKRDLAIFGNTVYTSDDIANIGEKT